MSLFDARIDGRRVGGSIVDTMGGSLSVEPRMLDIIVRGFEDPSIYVFKSDPSKSLMEEMGRNDGRAFKFGFIPTLTYGDQIDPAFATREGAKVILEPGFVYDVALIASKDAYRVAQSMRINVGGQPIQDCLPFDALHAAARKELLSVFEPFELDGLEARVVVEGVRPQDAAIPSVSFDLYLSGIPLGYGANVTFLGMAQSYQLG